RHEKRLPFPVLFFNSQSSLLWNQIIKYPSPAIMKSYQSKKNDKRTLSDSEQGSFWKELSIKMLSSISGRLVQTIVKAYFFNDD
ncbi:hypothetical protein BWI97_27165, partial [Siphonobacter sp. BAB-5405]|uniref:hypothetical protein n=1 Tax=Siphonobacter sp. BAB-5405 TaxID=1864825 RepID=UPI000CB3EDF5